MSDIDRLKSAVDSMKQGSYLKVGALTLGYHFPNEIHVTGYTDWSLENLTEDRAIEDLNDFKRIFIEMKKASEELSEYSESKRLIFQLSYNYGMGSILICKELDGQVLWSDEFKNKKANS